MAKKHIIAVLLVCIFTVFLGGVFGAISGYTVAKSEYKNVEDSKENKETNNENSTVMSIKEGSVSEIAENCNKSVVNITIKSRKVNYNGSSSVSETVLGHGTGVIIREDGYIVTCHHVIEGADVITVTTYDKQEYEATLVGQDPQFDMAVIRVNAANLPAALQGNSDEVVTGEQVVVIGNPLGEFGSSVSAGVLSAPVRELTIQGVPLRLMQTDAAVNPGNSGGALFNMQGQLIGMVNAKISASGIEGIGFAIPFNTIRDKMDSMIAGTATNKAYLGVSTEETVLYDNSQQIKCIQVKTVYAGSPAEKAGIKVGDYVLSVDGHQINGNDALTLAIKYRLPGEQVVFEVFRGNTKLSISVILTSV